MKQLISIYYDDNIQKLHIDIDDDMQPSFALEVIGKSVQTLRQQAEKIKAAAGQSLIILL